jgi:4-hydroxy-3-polyprenylbenzoate decarboxylase
MPFKDLREYIDRLEACGELMRVGAEVDWNLELGAITRRSMDLGGPALLFENIKDYPGGRVFANSLSRNKDKNLPFSRMAMALEMPRESSMLDLIREVARRIPNTVKPRLVDWAPCKENIVTGDDVDLLSLPTPYLHSMDGGRYIGTWHVDVTRQPDTGLVNYGIYRHVIHDAQTLGWLAVPSQHGPALYYEMEKRNEPLPIALAFGTDPIVTMVGGTSVAPNISEPELAGALRGAAIDVVKCETVPLEVPASSEIVIEGWALPHERRMEGPFGEFTGYAAPDEAERPVIKVSAITYRNHPILTMSNIGKPWNEDNVLVSVAASAVLTEELRRRGIRFKDLYVAPPSQAVIVSCDPPMHGYQHTLASAVWSCKYGLMRPYIFIVGEDVDVTDMEDVYWCLTTRLDPAHGIHIQTDTVMSGLWPWPKPEDRLIKRGSKVYFDATFPPEWPEDYRPQIVDFESAWPKDVRDKVFERWAEYGFQDDPRGKR